MTNCSRLILIVSISCCVSASGQQTGKIEPDRPDQSESAFIVPKKWFQSENGFNLEETRNGFRSFIHPTMLKKYGVSNRFELRLITEYVSIETPLAIPDGSKILSGLKPIIIGGKVALFEEKGLRPKTSVLCQTSIPKVASTPFKESKMAPSFRLAMQNTVTKKMSLGYNIGAEWDGESDRNDWFISLSASFELGKNWKSFIEIYNIFKEGEQPLNNVDGGVAYNVSNNFQIDFSYGYGLNNHAYFGHYFAFGFSFRVPTVKITRTQN